MLSSLSDLLLYVAGAKLDESDDSTGETGLSSLSDLLLYIAGGDQSDSSPPAEEDSTFSALLSYVIGTTPIFSSLSDLLLLTAGMGSIFSALLLYPADDDQFEVPVEVTALSDLLL